MGFDIKKKGYAVEQVDSYLKELENTSKAKDERISDLTLQVDSLKEELSKLQSKRELIVKAIYSALNKAEQIEQLTNAKYNAEMARLKAFHEKWTAYYNRLLEKYPIDDDIIAISRFNREMSETLGAPIKQHEAEQKRLSGLQDKEFNPLESIKEYLAADDLAATQASSRSNSYKTGIAVLNPALAGASDSGFSFEEALNPTDDLKDIMKDLGIMED